MSKICCPRPQCVRLISQDQYCCGVHWRHLPKEIKDMIFKNGPGFISVQGDLTAKEFWKAQDET